MKIIPLAFDSLGTRSMATYVETKNVKVLIDPGVALAPNRNGRPPHPIEIKLMMKKWKEIKKYAKKANVLIVTHYHYDHHNPEEPEIYKGKIVYLKHPLQKINASQKKRASYFMKKLGRLPKQIEYSDGRTFKFGKTTIKFSPALPHGWDEKLGCVTEVLIDDGKTRFIHTSDVEGATVGRQQAFIIQNDPDICLIDGPMTYIFGMHTRALSKIIQGTKRMKTLIVDHHYLRDLKWRDKLSKVYEAAAKKKVKLVCAAEFLKQKENLLEPIRKELFAKHPAKMKKPIYIPWQVKK
jgi:predicted metallo-beta-lactamase superfamily hydrolase